MIEREADVVVSALEPRQSEGPEMNETQFRLAGRQLSDLDLDALD